MTDLSNETGRADLEFDAPESTLERSGNLETTTEVQSATEKGSRVPTLDVKQAEAYLKADYALIKLHPLSKAALHRGWRSEAPLTHSDLREHMAKDGNVGVRLRAEDLIVDIDPRNGGDESFKRLMQDFPLPAGPVAITGSGGRHLYLRKPADLDTVVHLDAYPGIDFKRLGGYVVAVGSIHPETKQVYHWDPLEDNDLSAVPMAPEALLAALTRPPRVSSQEAGECTPEELEKLLEGLDPCDFADYDAWLKIGMAAHHGTNGAGEDVFVEWSARDPVYAGHEAQVRAKWASFSVGGGRQCTIGTIHKLLNDAKRGALVDAYMERRKSLAEEDFPDGDVDLPQSLADIALAETNQRHFTVLHGGKYLVGRERKHPTLGHLEVEWFSDHAVQSHLDSQTVRLDDGRRKPLGSWWVKHPMRRQYDGVVFDPSPTRSHEGLYNLWRGWAVEPKKGTWSHMKRLLRDVLCGGDQASFDYVIQWSAFMVQHPHDPAEVALAFKGPKGVGKGSFARALASLAGAHGKQVAQPEHFVGRFNEHLQDCILLFVDEGFWAGDKKAEGALKNLITEPTLTFEPKGRPIFSGPNMLHVVIVSNEDWVVPASADERRFAVFEVDMEARQALPPGFFDALRAEMDGGGLSAMLHELLSIDLGNWHPRAHVPKTKALVDQKVQAFRRDPMPFWWYRMLEAGEIDPILPEDPWRAGPAEFGTRDKEQLLLSLTDVARTMGRYGPFTKTALARFLRTVGVEVEARDKRANRVWRVPPLQDARLAFERHVGGKLEWDDA